jgi:hypothetical protein
MTKKLTMEDWDRIQKEGPSRYYVQSIEEGTVRVQFNSEIVCTERGDEDILGNVWTKEWSKNEAKVFINGEPKIYSLGGSTWSQIRDFISVCKANKLGTSDIPGSVFDIKKTGDWTQEIKYVGKAEDIEKQQIKPIKLSDNTIQEILDVIKDLKINSPSLLEGGLKKPDFLKLMRIRGHVESAETEAAIPELVNKNVIKVEADRIVVL